VPSIRKAQNFPGYIIFPDKKPVDGLSCCITGQVTDSHINLRSVVTGQVSDCHIKLEKEM
jgi:hypothetical protein